MTQDAKPKPGEGTPSPERLPVADAARFLSRLGREVITAAMIQQDLDAGAPANDDGTLNLLRYAAWLVKERRART